MPVGNGIRGIADIDSLGGLLRVIPTEQVVSDEMQGGGLRLFRWKGRVALPRVRTGLEARSILEIESGLVLQIMAEELRLDLGAKFIANRLAIIEIAQVTRGRRPGSMPPWSQHHEVLVLRVVGLELLVLLLRSPHVLLVVVAAYAEG